MIRKARREDIPLIFEIFAEDIPGTWSLEALGTALSDKTMTLLVWEEDAILGALLLKTCMEETEILLIATRREARRRGIARRLLAHAIEEAEAGTQFFLEVRSQSEAAIALYSALGFTPFSIRKQYYRHPVDDAVCMKFGKI